MPRILRFPELKPAGVPYCRKHVTTLEKKDEFPRHIKLGENSVGWIASEVEAWVEEKIRSAGDRTPLRRPADDARKRARTALDQERPGNAA